MSEERKYYYIKLKDNYFEQDNIKVLESMKNGHTYSLILIKLYLKASKFNGKLMMTNTIPYDPYKYDVLANVINHDVDHVKQAIEAGIKLDLITVLESGEIWMTEIQNFIGKSSTEADRIREYRKELDQKKIAYKEKKGVQMYNKSTPELELEKELEKEREPKEITETMSQALQLASLLLHKSREFDPKLHRGKDKAVTQRWARDIEKLIRIDGRSFTDIEAVIRWVKTEGNFWLPNIMSGKKLREKFPQLFVEIHNKRTEIASTQLERF
ncbi:MAG: phage replisome organizer N-terminal domain-containing protein [Spirochaetales bacterium]|nr:phage replisome organizer N-terminal domain-containing protein [Spirochaetales bacterium]